MQWCSTHTDKTCFFSRKIVTMNYFDKSAKTHHKFHKDGTTFELNKVRDAELDLIPFGPFVCHRVPREHLETHKTNFGFGCKFDFEVDRRLSDAAEFRFGDILVEFENHHVGLVFFGCLFDLHWLARHLLLFLFFRRRVDLDVVQHWSSGSGPKKDL